MRFTTNVSDPLFTKLSKSKGHKVTMKPELHTICRLSSKNTVQNGKGNLGICSHVCTLNTLAEMWITAKDILTSWTQFLLLRNCIHTYRLTPHFGMKHSSWCLLPALPGYSLLHASVHFSMEYCFMWFLSPHTFTVPLRHNVSHFMTILLLSYC